MPTRSRRRVMPTLAFLVILIVFGLLASADEPSVAMQISTATPSSLSTATSATPDRLLILTDLATTATCPTDLVQALETDIEAAVTQMQGASYTSLHQIVPDEAAAHTLIATQNAVIVVWGSCEDGGIWLHYALNNQRLNSLIRPHRPRDTDAVNSLLSAATLSLRPLNSWLNTDQGTSYAANFMAAQLYYFAEDYPASVGSLNAMIKVGNQITGGDLAEARRIELDAAHFFRAYILQQLHQQPQDSIADYDRVIQINPQDAHAYNNRGYVRDALGDYQAALQEYTIAIQLNPQLVQAYFNRGTVKNLLKDYQGALQDLNMALQLDPQNVFAYLNRGAVKQDLGDHQGALQDFSSTIQLFPEFAAPYNNRGNAKQDLGDYQGALQDYNRAVELDPKLVDGYFNRGNLRFKLKDYFGADDDYTTVIELDPRHAKAYNSRGGLRYTRGDYSGALEDHNMAIQLDPQDPSAYNNRGNDKHALGDDKGAIADFAHAIALDPQYVLAYNSRGFTRLFLGDYQAALKDFDLAIQIDPNYVDAYLNRGLVKHFLHDYHGAIADYDLVLHLDPSNGSAYYNRGISNYDLHNYQVAVEDFTNAIRVFPQLVDSYYNRGLAYQALSNDAAALADFRTYLQYEPNATDAQQRIAEIETRLGIYTPPATRTMPVFFPSPTFPPTRVARAVATSTATPPPSQPNQTLVPTSLATANPTANGVLLILTDLANVTTCPADFAQAMEAKIEATVTQTQGASFTRLHQIVPDEATAQKLVNEQNAAIVIWGSCNSSIINLNYTLNIQRLDTIARAVWLTNPKTKAEDKLKATSGITLRLFKSGIKDPREFDYVAKFVAAQLTYFADDYGAALDDLNAAIALSNQIVGQAPVEQRRLQLDSVYFFRAYIFQETQYKAQEALTDYDAVILLRPNDAYAYNNRGIIKRFLDDTDGALFDFGQAVQLNPRLAETYFNRANLLNDLGDYLGALDNFDRAIQLDPTNVDAYNNRGVARWRLGDSDGALEDYNHAIALDPTDASPYINRGIIKRRSADYFGAIEDFNRALELDPQAANAYANRGIAKYNLGNLQGAMEDYNRAIALDPLNVAAYINRGIAKSEHADRQGGLEDFSYAIQLDPNNADAYFNRGNVEFQLGDNQGALDDYTRVIEINPRYLAAYIGRGRVKQRIFDWKGAIDDFNHAIDLNPYIPEPYFRRASARYDSGDFLGAVKDYSTAIQLDPQFAEAYFGRGLAYKYLTNYQAALADFQTYLTLVPLSTEAQNQIAEILGFMTPPPYQQSPTRISPAFRASPTFVPTRANRLTATPTPSRTPTATSTPGPSPTYTATGTPLAQGLPVVMTALWKSGICSTASEISWKRQLETTAKTVTGGNFITLTEIAEDEASARQLMQKYGAVVVIWGECKLASLDLNFIVDVQRLDAMTRATWQSTHAAEGRIKDIQLVFPPILKIKLKGHFTVVYGMNYILAYLTYLSQDFTTSLQALDAGIGAGEQAAGKNIKTALELQLETGYFMRAYIFQTVQNLPEWAINEYNRALQVNPKAAYVYANRGVAKQMFGDMQGAFEDYTTAIQLEPRLAQAYFNRGLAYEATGDFVSALADFRAYVELVPDDPRGSAAIAEAEAMLNSASTPQPSATP